MLSELTIHDFAIIDRLQLSLGPGFSVLTGETGAGKSIIVDAVSLLLGGRGESDFVRSGADEARIEGVFILDQETCLLLNPLLERDGLEGDDDGVLILSREIRTEGRNVCRVNGRAVPLRVLSEIGQYLVDIHGQTEHLSLMRVREHVDLLDRYAGLWPLREQVAGSVRALRAVRQQLEDLRLDKRELARRVDLLRYQVSEIEAAHLEPGEEQELVQERTRLANAEHLRELADEVYRALYAGDDEQAAAVDLMQGAVRALAALTRLDPSLQALADAAEVVSFQLEDLSNSLRDYRDQVQSDPRRLSQVEERLHLIRTLQRKYGATVEEILAFSARAEEELEGIEHSEERIEELVAEEQRLLNLIGREGDQLSVRRREAGERLALGIERELAELSMPEAKFAVDIAWRVVDDGAYARGQRVAFDLSGLDHVEFLVAPNVGEPLKPLVRIASGGETSRLMLALKTVLSKADRTPTLIFDEIDAGIGGRVGSVVGQKLWGLTTGDGTKARQHQVLCVTHLPQLAGYGDVHFVVRKGVVDQRTVTEVRQVDGGEREREMAAMLGTATPSTLNSAREILLASETEKGHRQDATPA